MEYGGKMRGSKRVIRLVAILLLLAVTAGLCGCKKDTRTKDDFQNEATELSNYLIRRIFIADYASVKKYISKDEQSKVEPIISNMDTRLYKDANIEVTMVYTDPVTYETEIEYRITLKFERNTNSFFCQMTMSRSGSSWKISNALPFCKDMDMINDTYVNGMIEDENNRL